MRWILGLLGALLGSVLGDEEGLAVGALGGLLIGWLVERERARTKALGKPAQALAQTFEQRASARLIELTARVEVLERVVAELRAQSAPEGAGAAASETAEPATLAAAPARTGVQQLDERGYPLADQGAPLDAAQSANRPAAVPPPEHLEQGADPAAQAPDDSQQAPSAAQTEPPSVATSPAPLPPQAVVLPGAAALAAIRSFFLGGNTVVRVGIVVLTIGVGLLVKYAADQAYFPLELRLAFAAALGLGLVVFGVVQRPERGAFGTALQGGGVAALYLVTFFAFYAYHLVPGWLTLALLIAIAALSTTLAVVQNAQQLAVFGAIGGFLAPLLASTGGGSHVALFSYYALLNLAISGGALFRSWRVLNWVGFLFTFGIASAWGALQYKPENMGSASLFLALFFALYVTNGTLFSARKGALQRGAVDTTLTFGTPLATLALAAGLFYDEHLYLALSCVLIAAVYLALAGFILRTRDTALQTLARTYIAVGVAVATLAIPFALDDALGTALAWAAEASGLVWVGTAQARLRTRVAGYLLFVASLFALVAQLESASDGARALFCALIALALAFAAATIERRRSALHEPEQYVGHALLGLSLCVWAAGLSSVVTGFAPTGLRAASAFFGFAATTLLLDRIGARAAFAGARLVATLSFPLLLAGTLCVAIMQLEDGYRWLGFALAIAAGYSALRTNEASLREHPLRADVLHACGGWLVAVMVHDQLRQLTEQTLRLADGWVDAAAAAGALVIAALALAERPAWPLAAYPRAYLRWTAWPLVLLASAASLVLNFAHDGDAAPLPYLPLLNPFELIDALRIALLLLIVRHPAVHGQRTRELAWWTAAATGFVTLSGMVVRTAHHWAKVPFVPFSIPSDPTVQAAFSIVWTVLALIAMLLAHRRRARGVWVAGAVLLGAVVLKLFLVDLSSLSGVAKIVTFLAVGLLLLLIGYFAPVPPSKVTEEARP